MVALAHESATRRREMNHLLKLCLTPGAPHRVFATSWDRMSSSRRS